MIQSLWKMLLSEQIRPINPRKLLGTENTRDAFGFPITWSDIEKYGKKVLQTRKVLGSRIFARLAQLNH